MPRSSLRKQFIYLLFVTGCGGGGGSGDGGASADFAGVFRQESTLVEDRCGISLSPRSVSIHNITVDDGLVRVAVDGAGELTGVISSDGMSFSAFADAERVVERCAGVEEIMYLATEDVDVFEFSSDFALTCAGQPTCHVIHEGIASRVR